MRFKSIIAAFAIIFSAVIIGAIIFIQTDRFGKVLSKVVSDLSRKKIDAQVSLKSIDLSLFPPGIELVQVKVQKKIDGIKDLDLELGKLGFYVGFLELEDKRLTLGEVKISESTISYNAPETDEELEEIDEKIINKIFNYHLILPLKLDTLVVENTSVHFNHDLLNIRRAKVIKKKDNFIARLNISNLRPIKDKELTIDELWLDAIIGKKNLNIQRLKVQHDVHGLLLKGKISNYRLLKKAKVKFLGESSVYLGNIQNTMPIPAKVQFQDGVANINFNFSYDKSLINVKVDLAINNLESNLLDADQIIAGIDFDNSTISLQDLKIVREEQILDLEKRAILYSQNSKKWLPEILLLKLENFNLQNALQSIPSLEILHGKMSGNLSFELDKSDFYINLKDGFVLSDLGLITAGKEPFKILMIKKAVLSKSNLSFVNEEFQVDSVIKLQKSLLEVSGSVNSERVDFVVPNAVIDLEDFGNISNLGIKGRGTLDLIVQGTPDDTALKFKGKTQNFEILGYKLGNATKDISINLKDQAVIIKNFESRYRNTPIMGSGAVNYGSSDIALTIEASPSSYSELKDILRPILLDMDFLPQDLDLNARIATEITGKTNIEGLRVDSSIRFADLQAYGEAINGGTFDLRLKKQVLKFENIKMRKGQGKIDGSFQVNLSNKKMKPDLNWDNIALSSLNISKKIKLNLDGSLSGDFSGEGTPNDYNFRLNNKLTETKTPDYRFGDSVIALDLMPNRFSGKLNLLGEVLKSKFDVWLNNKSSSFEMSFNAADFKSVASAFLGQHVADQEFNGALKFNVESKFKKDLSRVTLTGRLQELRLNHENFKFDYFSEQPQFIIENDEVKKWSLNIQDEDFAILTKGSGRFDGQLNLIHEFNFNMRLMELFFSPILSATGFINNTITLSGKSGDYNLAASSTAKSIDLSLDSMPFPLNNLSYKIDFSRNRLYIQELKTSLENGVASLKGDVFFNDDTPDMNIKFNLDKAEIPILGKSFVNLSGEGMVLGNDLPYGVNGEIVINKASIINELTEFGNKSSALSQIRFLPPNQESPIGKILTLNVNVKADNPLRITNSMMDVSLKGEVRLTGNPARPRGDGRLYAPPTSSRIFFKNSEYLITNADLNFNPKKEITNPDFDIQATTLVSNYKVNAKAYGDLGRFNFDLTSDPVLPRNSILSLIAFGYTDDLQNTLKQEDQTNLTQLGVGSFVFDRFKISDILNKQFGLQVNLGTVFEQSQDSLLTGRTQEGQGTVGRTRSATKIELRKKLDEALTLSVSSTMGGSIGQRQSMNLNYSINKKVQVEGIYQLRTNEEGVEDIIDNSIGADLKFRWTFK